MILFFKSTLKSFFILFLWNSNKSIGLVFEAYHLGLVFEAYQH